MANVIKAIEKTNDPITLINDSIVFEYSLEDVKRNIGDQIYRKRFGKYILLLLEYLMHDHNTIFPDFTKLSIEHILPQHPSKQSNWTTLFTTEEIEKNIHTLGNLLLISRSKNSSLGRKDFLEKKKTYFTGAASVFPNSVRVMQYNDWTLPLLQQRHKDLLDQVIKHYS